MQRCGRDFRKIADYPKTKNVDKVDQYLVDLLKPGRADQSDLADLVDARLQQEAL